MIDIPNKNTQGAFTLIVDHDNTGKRLDLFVAEKMKSAQRSRISDLISDGSILVNETLKKPSYKVKSEDLVTGVVPPVETHHFSPENIALDIIYDDDDIIVINKQPGLVVHPAPGNWSGTLVNGLLYHYPDIKNGDNDCRPGIVHRLDRDTSGVMVIAKNQKSLLKLSESFQARYVKKEYIALVHGQLKADSGIIDSPIGRHPVDRKKMSVVTSRGKQAETHYHVDRRFRASSLIRCDIKTGRTHQIRVHCLSIQHPVVGDPVYSFSLKSRNGRSYPEEMKILGGAKRQMLHALNLEILHPATQTTMIFSASIPRDMAELIEKLESNPDQ